MSALKQISNLGSYTIGIYKNILYGRSNWLNPIQLCNYTKVTAESKLGIEKPKRPLTPFFKFMVQMRPALLAKNPGITSKEAIVWSSKHWQQLDAETKNQLTKEYEKDMEDYKKIKMIYDSSLTDSQKEDIKKVKEAMVAAKEKRKFKLEMKELGKPKRPLSSYFLFSQAHNNLLFGKTLVEFQKTIKELWDKLVDSEKLKYEKQATELMNKYRKDIDAWEKKMVSIGRPELVRVRKLRSANKNAKNIK